MSKDIVLTLQQPQQWNTRVPARGHSCQTFLSAATGSEKRVGKKFESPARSDIAADKNVRAPVKNPRRTRASPA